MPKLEYFLAALSISLDQTSNLVSLFHVLEQFACKTLPLALPNFVAASSWIFSEDELGKDFQVIIRIHYPPGQDPRQSEDQRINFTPDRVRFRTLFYLNGIEVTTEGPLRLELLLDGKHQADHTITVVPQAPDDA